MLVPPGAPTGTFSMISPPVMTIRVPGASSSFWGRVMRVTRETAAMLASASPRKPSVLTVSRSVMPAILLVAWGVKASSAFSGDMPVPSSVIRSDVISVFDIRISIRIVWAPASIAFSTSSLTTEAGRSTTSPAAILLTVA